MQLDIAAQVTGALNIDLDATPRCKARLAEPRLRWPPPQTIKYLPLTVSKKP